MAKVKVWNDNAHPYDEVFKGDKIAIPAKSYIEMEYEEAIEFKGSFGRGLAPVGEDGNPDPTYFKMIRVERPPQEAVAADPLVNHLTGQRANSAEELLQQLAAIASNRPDLVVKDPDLDGSKASKAAEQDKRIAELERQIAQLVSAQAPKKGPGGRVKEAVG